MCKVLNTRTALGLLLLAQAKKQLAQQGVELRCNHEILPFDSVIDKGLRVDIQTVEKYCQPDEQACIEREMIREQVELFVGGL